MTSAVRASLMLPIHVWPLTIPENTVCMFARDGSFQDLQVRLQFDRFEREGRADPCYRRTCGHYHLSYLLAVSCWAARPDDQVVVLDKRVQNGGNELVLARAVT